MRLMRVLYLGTLLGSGLACGTTPNDDPAAERRTLAIGDYGQRVLDARQYLTLYGYFPNPDLEARFPAWRPMLPSSQGDPARFDEGLATALDKYQKNNGLAVNGTLDEATFTALKGERCAVPDTDPSDRTHTGKWALTGAHYNKTTITFSFDVPAAGVLGLSRPQVFVGIGNASISWPKSTNLTFVAVPPTDPADIRITFGPIDPANALGSTTSTGLILNSSVTWNVPMLTHVVAHEIGHLMGLNHSSNWVQGITPIPLMAARSNTGLQIDDDKIASNVLYDVWQVLPGLARDIGVNGSVWIIGTGDNRPWNWNGSTWIKSDFGVACSRVDVDSNGRPWVVAASHQVYRLLDNVWTLLPGGGLLNDIGIGAGADQIYGLGTNGQLFRFQNNFWSAVNSITGSTSVDVDPDGFPWVIAANGNVQRCSTGGCTTVAFGVGQDIGVGGRANFFGAANWAWLIGGGDSIWALDAQSSIPGGPGSETPAVNAWINTNGLARRISVGTLGAPWVVNSAGNIYHRAHLADF